MPEMKTILAMIAIVAVSAGASGAAVGEAEKCLATKMKIVGKYEACRMKAESLAVLKETPADNSKCESKFSDSWQKAEAKYGLDCVTDGDELPINDHANDHVIITVALLNNLPAGCGNNVIQSGEACDGTDLDGETCVSQGYDGGTLACTTCFFDYSGCETHECNLIDQTGCGVGEACYPLGQSEHCANEGTAIEGQGCMFANSCVGGMACVDYGMGNVCAPFCDNIDNVPGCAGMQTCTNVPAWDGPNVGYCEP
jgi:hypothetical protein